VLEHRSTVLDVLPARGEDDRVGEGGGHWGGTAELTANFPSRTDGPQRHDEHLRLNWRE
jgi:hypothetical protein